MGQSPDSTSYNSDKQGVPFYQGNADFGALYPKPRIWCNKPIKLAKENDILISVRAPVGALNFSKEECCIGRGLASITLDSNDFLLEFIYWSLRTGVKELQNKSTGSTFKSINKKTLEEVRIPKVPLKEQKDIIRNLTLLTNILAKYKHEIVFLDELVKARFVEMFGDPVTNDMLWNTDVLKDICTKIGSGSTPRGGKESYIDEGISLIRSMNVHNAYFEYKDLAHITLDQAEKLNNVVVEHDDLLFNITGASVARCCVVPSDVLPARVNQHVCILRCREKINPIFLQELLVNENYQGKLLQIAKSGATREAINKQQLESLEIMLPPLELQNQFASFVEEIDKSGFIESFTLSIIHPIKPQTFYVIPLHYSD